jgi:TolB protein
MLPRPLALTVAALMLTLPRVALSQPGQDLSQADLVVHPRGVRAFVIAVPPFAGGGAGAVAEIPQVILRNLEIAGWFQSVSNPQFAARQDAADRQTGQINFPEWSRLGAQYLVRGDAAPSGSGVTAEIHVYDVAVGRQVIGRSYPAEDPRDLAHHIADDVVQNIVGERGFARSRILFINETGQGNRELSVMDADGGRRRQLTNDNATVMASCWGANNTEIYFTSTRDFNPDLCGMFLDGSRTWYISRFPGLNLSPAWNPETGRIALTLSKDGNSEIYTMSRGGDNPLRLTYNRAIDASPWWMPDGAKILFTSDRQTGRPQIWVMDSDGRNQTRLTTRTGYAYNDGASISPDGRRVVFSSRLDGQFDVFMMNIDGSDSSWVRLTDSPADDEDPCWVWDGQHVVFCSDRTGGHEIFIMNADGSNVHQLTTRGGSLNPMAEPLPPGE